MVGDVAFAERRPFAGDAAVVREDCEIPVRPVVGPGVASAGGKYVQAVGQFLIPDPTWPPAYHSNDLYANEQEVVAIPSVPAARWA
jgi:hypothetical protein